MCSGCGILQNKQDWFESFGDSPASSQQKLAERRKRISLVNEILHPCGLILREQGWMLILSNQTGNSTIVSNLSHVWAEADRLGIKKANPLDF